MFDLTIEYGMQVIRVPMTIPAGLLTAVNLNVRALAKAADQFNITVRLEMREPYEEAGYA